MKKTIAALLAALLALCLAGCGKQEPAPAADSFTLALTCESADIYQIFYSVYLNGEYYGMGGIADLDHKALSPDTPYTLTFTESYFEGADISAFSITFSPYGKDDTSEIATTEPVAFAAQYGQTYAVVFAGDRDSGFTAQLQS